ncbi:MAG: type II toxin-antitoxin system VapC family toxin [Phycisphaerae bacterium]|nr:type II toxin-antitoxin system VapC family toxin [Phycisphaerae bacterium]
MIDASVAGKWFLREEQGADHARRLFDLAALGEWRLVAPMLLVYELPNILLRNIRQKRLKTHKFGAAVDEFLGLPILFYGLEARTSWRVVRVCELCGLGFYDASYVALADAMQAVLATGDARMAAAAELIGVTVAPVGI